MAKWLGSEEKEMLRNDIVNDIVSDQETAKDVYEMHDGAYHKFRFERFKVNLQNLRKSLKQQFNSAQYDQAALISTLQDKQPLIVGDHHGYPKWHGSRARTLLLQDIDAGIIDGIKPAILQKTRPE